VELGRGRRAAREDEAGEGRVGGIPPVDLRLQSGDVTSLDVMPRRRATRPDGEFRLGDEQLVLQSPDECAQLLERRR